MKDLVENHHMSVKGAARFVYEDSGGKVTEERARQVYIRRTKGNGCSCEHSENQAEKESKKRLKRMEEVVEEILSGSASDDDVKKIGDAIADSISSGTREKRVGTAVTKAVIELNRSRKEVKVKEPDNYRRLWDHVLKVGDGLQLLADGSILNPETEDESEALRGLLMGLPHICLHSARLGVDLMEIHEVYLGGENGKRPEDKKKAEIKYIENNTRENIIDIGESQP
jgi:hypothetical protein